MAKKLKLTPDQAAALAKLRVATAPMAWSDLKAPGPSIGRLLDMELVERRQIGGRTHYIITQAGREAGRAHYFPATP